MKRNIVAAIVASLILFTWQALSWMALPIHNDSLKYTAAQEEIMSQLDTKLQHSGAYLLPGTDPNTDMTWKQMEEESKKHIGKPWALIFYNTSFEGMSAGNLVTELLFNLVAVIICICLLRMTKGHERTFMSRFVLVMFFPLFCIFQSVLISWNWWSFPWHFIKGEMIDLILGWALCGIYLSWYLRKPAVA